MSYRVKIHTPSLVNLAKKCGMTKKALKKFATKLEAFNGDDTPIFDMLGSKLRKIEERLASVRGKDGEPVTLAQVAQYMEKALDWYYRFLARDYYHINSEFRVQEESRAARNCVATATAIGQLEDALKTLKGDEWNANDGIDQFPALHAALKVAALLRCEKPDCGLRCDCWEIRHWCESNEEFTSRMKEQEDEAKDHPRPRA